MFRLYRATRTGLYRQNIIVGVAVKVFARVVPRNVVPYLRKGGLIQSESVIIAMG